MNARHVSILVRMELRRRYRSFLAQRRRVAITAVVGVFMLLPIGVATVGAYLFGEAIASGDLDVPIWFVRAMGGGALGFVAFMGTMRTVQTAAVPANVDALVTTATHREVVTSIVCTEVLTLAALFGTFGFLAAVAFGVGAGSILAALGFGAAVGCVIVLGTVVGLVFGFGIRVAIARSALLARYKTAIGVLLFLAYFLALTASDAGEGASSIFETVGVALGRTPLGWFGDLALVGVGAGTSPLLAAGALVLTGICVPVGGVIVDRLAAALWYEESTHGASETRKSSNMGGVGGVPRPVARIARKSWIRAWRSPIRLLYVAYPLFLLVEPLSSAFRTGTIPGYLPPLVALYAGWATGAAFTLNPIGDETDVLPVTLTTPVDGRTFMAGCCLAGVVIGVPFSLVVTMGVAVAAGLTPQSIVAVAVLAILLPTAGPVLATGIGATFPRMEPVNVTRGRKAVVPSLFGFAVYSLGLSVLAAPGLVTALPGDTGLTVVDGSPTVVVAGGVGLTVLLLGVVGAASFRHAVRTFDDYYLA